MANSVANRALLFLRLFQYFESLFRTLEHKSSYLVRTKPLKDQVQSAIASNASENYLGGADHNGPPAKNVYG